MSVMLAARVLGVLFLQSCIAKEFSSLDHIKTTTDPSVQALTVKGLIHRLIPERANEFTVVVDPKLGPPNRDTFRLYTGNGQLYITGTTGVAASWGFYYYLSQYCYCHISWAGDQVKLPDQLPQISKPGIHVTSNDRFRYYQNVCTSSYSFVWWNWTRWEREIDWMVMNGINLPLAFTAQEAIWQRTYSKMGFTQEELDAHFAGPAFLAWARMGNINGWGGPLPPSWHQQQLVLQQKILDRMRSFGITPVLPAFAGHVPASITKYFPKANVSHMSDWGHFQNKSYCCTTLLDVEDPLFPVIGKAFLTEYIKEFGTNHIYNADTFNEMTPRSSSPKYLQAAGQAVYNGMLARDPQAIWLMQGWLFNSPFWQEPQVKALVTSVPQGKLIILDLIAELTSFYDKFDSYYGQPFIWCMLHNFGGTLPLYGVIDNVNKRPFQARAFPNSTMIGIGISPEGINQNNVMYEFMLENSWRRAPVDSISDWSSFYGERRYGHKNSHVSKAWPKFAKTVYNCMDKVVCAPNKRHRKNIIDRRPSKDLVPDVWYDKEVFYQGWDEMIKASNDITDSSLFRYDLVDVTRQSLQLIAIQSYNSLITAYQQKDLHNVISSGQALLDLLSDLDQILATDPHFLLGRWLEDAKVLGTTEAEKQLYEYNARVQITTWGPHEEILDYANKQWSGIMKDYYRARWELFVTEIENALREGKHFNESKYNIDAFEKVEQPFTFDRSLYPSTPIGDQIYMAKRVHQKYRPQTMKKMKLNNKNLMWNESKMKFTKQAKNMVTKFESLKEYFQSLLLESHMPYLKL